MVVDQADERVGACWHAQPLGKSRAGLAAECQAEGKLKIAEPAGAPGMARPDLRQWLGKDAARAAAVGTAQPSDNEANDNLATLPGQIGQTTLVAAVQPH